jgi:hypothetical protein
MQLRGQILRQWAIESYYNSVSSMFLLRGLLNLIKANAESLRFNRTEIAGSLDDPGISIPLLAGMMHRCGLQLGPGIILCGHDGQSEGCCDSISRWLRTR